MKLRQSHKRKRGAPLGQHFLTNPRIADAVADAAGVTEGDVVVEVGPGKGILTRALLTRGARVIAIEKDPAMIHFIYEMFPNEIRNKQLRIVGGDVRDVLHPPAANLPAAYKVAANIPYYLTGELIRLFLTAKKQPSVIAFLVQKEVAERIARSKKESLLSLSVKVFGAPRYVKTIRRGSFSPAPSVDSAILAISGISKNNFGTIVSDSGSEELFFKVIKAGFAQKRKTLGGNLKRVFGERALAAMGKLHLSEKIRAEDVPLEMWLALTKEF